MKWRALRWQRRHDTQMWLHTAGVSLAVLRIVESGARQWDTADTPARATAESSVEAAVDTAYTFLGGQFVQPITAAETTIGRGLHNGVVLLDPAVSREHARLAYTHQGWRIENVSTQNALWVGAELVEPGASHAVPPGALLHLGESVLQLLAPTDEEHLWPVAGAPVATADAGSSERAEPDMAGQTHVLAPGVTVQFALRRLRGARRWQALLLLGLTFAVICAGLTLAAVALVGRSAAARGGVGQVLLALSLPLAPVLGVSLLVALIDRYEREPWLLLFGAFVWGGAIAVAPVLLIEGALHASVARALGGGGAADTHALTTVVLHALSAGVTEEVCKGAGLILLLLALRDEFDNVTDGILYGLLIGAGFALVENYLYVAGSTRAELPTLVGARVILGWLSHSTFTALFGAGLGFVRETRGQRGRWRATALGLVAAIALHTWFDSVVLGAEVVMQTVARSNAATVAMRMGILTVAAIALSYGMVSVAQGWLLRLALAALRREAAVVRAHLADEVVRGTVTPDEYVLVQDAALRGRNERHIFALAGIRAYLTLRALHQAVIGLAFRHWHVLLGAAAKSGALQPEDAYRARIAQLRRSLARQTHQDAAPAPISEA